MSRSAVISDIHGNLHAFQAVLSRIDAMGIENIICLGDIVGYGPSPDACFELTTKRCSTIIRGNHDDAILDPSIGEEFNEFAKAAIDWTRDILDLRHIDRIAALPAFEEISALAMCVHDCPIPGPTDYIHDKEVAAMAFRGVDRIVCMVGHTHVPMVFATTGVNHEQDVCASEVAAIYLQDQMTVQFEEGARYICNPGSVGQPRDCDPRASFAILDEDARTFTVYREPYDVDGAREATINAGLPTILGDRLAIGA